MAAPDLDTGCSGVRAIDRLMGDSMAMRALRKAIAKVAPVQAPVLITGETGTGKELVARSLCDASGRADGPFVAVNCAAVPEDLFHAEVFGYEKGAFTGAVHRHAGRVEAAQGGTLLLDEIGDLSLDAQVVLLRFLEEGLYERLGSTRTHQADVRILASTNADLESACRKGMFREDLYYRLNALRLRMPPLRERGNDIEQLAETFLAEFTCELALAPHRFDAATLELIRRHSWPGNVRELRNRIRQALVMSENELLRPVDMGLARQADESVGAPPSQGLREIRQNAERDAVRNMLNLTGGNIEITAARLGVSRATLYRLIRQHHIDPAESDRRRASPKDATARSPHTGPDRRRLADRRTFLSSSRQRREG